MKYKNIIVFTVFVLFIAFIASLFNIFVGFAIIFAITGISAFIYVEKNNLLKKYKDYIGLVIAHVGGNNNYRLAIMATLTLMCFFIAIKTGPGKPVLITAYHDLTEEIDQQLDKQQTESLESANKKIYKFFWGEEKTNEKFSAAPNDNTDKRGGWFWWKLSFMYLFFTIIYIIPAFSDEILDFINDIIIRIKNMKDEIKLKLPPEPATPGATVTGTVKTTPFSGSKIGWFGRLYGSDLASEFTIRLLQGVAKLFSKI
ncbi:hypothetical protein DRH27_02275 [Candidatus Falkowbacteria bacterium]|nr:MAG: hypothetical protein DRH27_02275 [Candidatus Falkowbacteria bacterium]